MKKLSKFFVIIAILMTTIQWGVFIWALCTKDKEVALEGLWYCFWWMGVLIFSIYTYIDARKHDHKYHE